MLLQLQVTTKQVAVKSRKIGFILNGIKCGFTDVLTYGSFNTLSNIVDEFARLIVHIKSFE